MPAAKVGQTVTFLILHNGEANHQGDARVTAVHANNAVDLMARAPAGHDHPVINVPFRTAESNGNAWQPKA
jgi:hypothetical protein